ncbi:hypothetical protein [Mucilaginibacter psychrotolerans]|uniref:Uncharacterized protein n=1 Tax=Mucilaginibacter psychrotolerans TaxID=1524096 RepID=A0A4Y8SEM5_9SPHI|nr:hypothetical protein [Mucilaginibacter psychrotolerans]TFF37121.1 hypothetical protein E2R66_13645 [Mucilaginibacter psychrotolerans]
MKRLLMALVLAFMALLACRSFGDKVTAMALCIPLILSIIASTAIACAILATTLFFKVPDAYPGQ